MSNVVISTLCLLCVGICSLPGGDSANFSLQRRPLDVSPLSANVLTRMKRSLLASRVIDHHGNPVNLRGNGQPVRRRVMNPFVTSHGRHQRTRTFGGPKQNFNRRPAQKQRLVTVQKPRQILSGSRGFAMFKGQRYDIRPDQGLVPHSGWQVQANQQRRYSAPANQDSRHVITTNQQGRIVSSSNQKATRRPHQGSVSSRIPSNGRQTVSRHPQKGSRHPQTISRHPQTTSRHPQTTSRHPQTISRHPQTTSRHPQTISRHPQTISRHPQTGSRPSLGVGESFYEHGLEAHMPLNARNMTTFLVQTSGQQRPFVDRTKGTGTIFSSHPGQCPVVDQSRCAPLPAAPLPPSCSNDYHCHGERSKCCYDPCLTISKCVRPING